MPLSIIRNDITRMQADAIVNTANPDVAVGRGTDYAVYKAAGIDRLLEARNMIGPIEPGHAAVTSAYDLDAKYIIHTVGPAWRGGASGERETAASCYRSCLAEADRLGCESVAFPLISTGTYGFPKDEALDIAIREISSFLEDHDMDISLVVYDKESFNISAGLFSDIKSYIDDAEQRSLDAVYSAPYGNKKPLNEEKSSRRRGVLRRLINRTQEERFREEILEGIEDEAEMASSPAPMYAPQAPITHGFDADLSEDTEESIDEISEATGAFYTKEEFDASLEDLLRARDESFQQKLFKMIDARGLTDPEVYKKANIDRKLFSKIRSNAEYKPTKKTAVAFAIALGLNIDETTDLLRSAGMTLSPSSSFDIIIRYCIEHGITNIHQVNCILFEFDQMLLGA